MHNWSFSKPESAAANLVAEWPMGVPSFPNLLMPVPLSMKPRHGVFAVMVLPFCSDIDCILPGTGLPEQLAYCAQIETGVTNEW